LDLAVARSVNSQHELVYLLLGHFPVSLHVAQRIVDQVEDLRCLQSSALVNIVLAEHSVDGLIELLVRVSRHILINLIQVQKTYPKIN
jgi:hypothetical protein